MIGWLWRMIVGHFRSEPPHQHEWETIKVGNLTVNDMSFGRKLTSTGDRYTLRCKGCGEIQHKDVV